MNVWTIILTLPSATHTQGTKCPAPRPRYQLISVPRGQGEDSLRDSSGPRLLPRLRVGSYEPPGLEVTSFRLNKTQLFADNRDTLPLPPGPAARDART